MIRERPREAKPTFRQTTTAFLSLVRQVTFLSLFGFLERLTVVFGIDRLERLSLRGGPTDRPTDRLLG